MTNEKLIEEAVAQALSESDDRNHEDLCHCGLWPASCVTYGDRRPWSHDAESVARAAALAVFEKVHTPTAHEVTTDAQVNAAMNAHRLSDLLNSGYGPERFHESPDLSYWHPDNVSNMRAALRAANEVRS